MLSIIGIIAEATIPTLVVDTMTKTNIVKTKKIYSVLSNAVRLASVDYGDVSQWISVAASAEVDEDGNLTGYTNIEGAENIGNILQTGLKVSKDCGMKGKGCFASGKYKTMDGREGRELNENLRNYKFMLVDGTSIAINTTANTLYNYCNLNYGSSAELKKGCATVLVDINGASKPNKYGVDTFFFAIMANSTVVPFGRADFVSYWSKNKACDKKSTKADNGYGCAAWVIQNENMDYMKCDDLDWDGKLSCN